MHGIDLDGRQQQAAHCVCSVYYCEERERGAATVLWRRGAVEVVEVWGKHRDRPISSSRNNNNNICRMMLAMFWVSKRNILDRNNKNVVVTS